MRSTNLSLPGKARLPLSRCGPKSFSKTLATTGSHNFLALVLLSALLLIAAQPAQAQTETVLYNFTGSPDGNDPTSRLTADSAGNFYGTTYYGGDGSPGFGTVFELSPNGGGGWNETVLYRFTGGADGAYPAYSDVIFDSAGNLYGTTYRGGGEFGLGVAFQLTPNGGGWTESVLHVFKGGEIDGGHPESRLIMDKAGNFYGTTFSGGNTQGTVFELSPAPGGTWTERIIYGAKATYAGLTMDAAGNIFGTTRDQKVFELSPNGNGGWNASVIHVFTGSPNDGAGPYGTLVFDSAGNLYGTTRAGGTYTRGTVYELSPGPNGWTERILYSFRGGINPKHPLGGVVLDAAGNIYGTTTRGTVATFELVNIGGGSYTFKILCGDGSLASLFLDTAGNLYGTSLSNPFGGIFGKVFECTP